MKQIKKKALLITMLFASVLIMSSCGNKAVAPTDTKAATSGSPRAFSQNQPDLYGEVKAVNGNDITLALLELPQRTQLSDEDRQKMMEQRKNNPKGEGDKPQDQGDRPQGQRNNDRNNQPRQGIDFTGEKKFTGASETLNISADVSITAFGRGNGNVNPEQKKLSLSDIKVGSIIQVWYKKDSTDKEEIQSIRVIQIPG